MIVELARRVSSCGWVALCERRRAGFARLSGWQPVGNWVASGANFPASLLPVGVIPTTSRESRRTVCVGKWPRSQAESDPAYRRKAETIPRGGGSFFATAADAPGAKNSALDTLFRLNDDCAPAEFRTPLWTSGVGCGAVPNRQSNEIIICGPKADGTYWVEFRSADGRVHCAMLESGARVPPHCLEAVHSRLRAAQVVQV
jgi:hypothetical protein